MSYFRQIHTLIWKDEDFMNMSTPEKLLFIYFFSNESTTLSGLYKIPLRVVCFETGLAMRVVTSALEKLEGMGKIYYRDGYVFVKKFQQYNKGGDKVAIAIKNEIESVPDSEIKRIYMEYYHPEIPYAYPIISRVEKRKEKKSIEEAENYFDSSKDFTEFDREERSESEKESSRAAGIYMGVTGNMGMPMNSDKSESTISAINKIYERKGDETKEYCQKFFKEWVSRKYSKTNPGWLDWALAGEIPQVRKPAAGNKPVATNKPTEEEAERMYESIYGSQT